MGSLEDGSYRDLAVTQEGPDIFASGWNTSGERWVSGYDARTIPWRIPPINLTLRLLL